MTEEAEDFLYRFVCLLDDLDSATVECTHRMYQLAKEARTFLSRNPHWKARIRCPLCAEPHDAINRSAALTAPPPAIQPVSKTERETSSRSQESPAPSL